MGITITNAVVFIVLAVGLCIICGLDMERHRFMNQTDSATQKLEYIGSGLLEVIQKRLSDKKYTPRQIIVPVAKGTVVILDEIPQITCLKFQN